MMIGYARVSTDEQDTQAQFHALKEAGCERIFTEAASGGRWDRPELHRMLGHLRQGDTVVVWKLDRLTRSLKDLLNLMDQIEQSGSGFRSLTEHIDTVTPAGRMMMQMLGAFAEFERAMIRERTKAGLDIARQQGRIGGRPASLNPGQRQAAIDMIDGGRSQSEVARVFEVSRSTICRLVARHRQEQVKIREEQSDL